MSDIDSKVKKILGYSIKTGDDRNWEKWEEVLQYKMTEWYNNYGINLNKLINDYHICQYNILKNNEYLQIKKDLNEINKIQIIIILRKNLIILVEERKKILVRIGSEKKVKK